MENTGKDDDEEMLLAFRESRLKCEDFAVRRSRDVAFTSHKDHSKPKQMRAPPQMQMTPSSLCVPASESDSTVVYRRNDCILILLAPACACGGSSQHVSQETDKTDHACQPCLDVEAQLCATSTAWGQYFSDMFNHV